MQTDKILNHLINKNGLCPSGIEIFNVAKNDINKIISASKRWVELFIEHENSLNMLEFLSKNDVDDFSKNGIFFNQKITLKNPNFDTIILLGNTEAEIEINDFGVIRIYALNDSKLNLKTRNFSIVQVDSHHRSKIILEKKDNSKIKISQYDKSSVEGEAEITKKEWIKNEIFNYKH